VFHPETLIRTNIFHCEPNFPRSKLETESVKLTAKNQHRYYLM